MEWSAVARKKKTNKNKKKTPAVANSQQFEHTKCSKRSFLIEQTLFSMGIRIGRNNIFGSLQKIVLYMSARATRFKFTHLLFVFWCWIAGWPRSIC